MRLLTKAEDVTDHLLVLVANCVEDWFPPEYGMPEEEFIDRLCNYFFVPEGYDIEQLDTPAVRKILRYAKRTRREMV